MPQNPIILIHGYSDEGESLRLWQKFLISKDYDVIPHIVDYETLTNEITIKDIAEAFNRALLEQVGLDDSQPFDAIVHSTGMLVIRSWLTTYGHRRKRLKRLIGLAPATWGSPLAHKGRSWLGAIFKGSKDFTNPDFMEAGDQVLDALELGSRFTWDLAHADLFAPADDAYYSPDADTPWVFTLCGIDTYGGLRSFVNEPGMDGTVRWAGCSLNSRKLVLDLTKQFTDKERFKEEKTSAITSPFIPIRNVNHGTILDPHKSETLQNLVLDALKVNDINAFKSWFETADQKTRYEQDKLKGELGLWQQFIVRGIDERGDPIPDYHLSLIFNGQNPLGEPQEFNVDIHTYKADSSLRCFHINLNELNNFDMSSVELKIVASTGSQLLNYAGYASKNSKNKDGVWTGVFDMSKIPSGMKVFFPFTTTLIELKLDRVPKPDVCKFI